MNAVSIYSRKRRLRDGDMKKKMVKKKSKRVREREKKERASQLPIRADCDWPGSCLPQMQYVVHTLTQKYTYVSNR